MKLHVLAKVTPIEGARIDNFFQVAPSSPAGLAESFAADVHGLALRKILGAQLSLSAEDLPDI